MPAGAAVVRRYGREYLDPFGEERRPRHRRARADLLACRTEPRGGHLYHWDDCGREPYVYRACRHRSGPKCHDHDTEAWLAERRQERLPGSALPVVLPLPHEWRVLVRRHQQGLYDILRRAAAPALITLAADPPDVGGLIGILGVLHTWPRALVSHPHVHGLVPAAGVASDRPQGQPARQTDLVPVRALSKPFRGLFRALGRQEGPTLSIPEAVWTTEWVVYGQPTVQGTAQVRRDWGRDVYRSALTNNRILSIDEGQGRCRDQDSQRQRCTTMALPAQACIRRVLPPVWPQGFPTGRADGRWSPAHRALLHRVQLGLAGSAPTPSPAAPEPAPCPADRCPPPLRAGQTGPHCGHGLLVLSRTIPRRQRRPP
jgi:Putative transposase/Transposase zinc-binding domain